jgi:hypothetical protein
LLRFVPSAIFVSLAKVSSETRIVIVALMLHSPLCLHVHTIVRHAGWGSRLGWRSPDDSHRIGVLSALRRRPARTGLACASLERQLPPVQRGIKSNTRLSRRCNTGKDVAASSWTKSNKRLQKRCNSRFELRWSEAYTE